MRIVSVLLVTDCVMEAVRGPSRQTMPVFVTGSFPAVGLQCCALEEVRIDFRCFLIAFLRVWIRGSPASRVSPPTLESTGGCSRGCRLVCFVWSDVGNFEEIRLQLVQRFQLCFRELRPDELHSLRCDGGDFCVSG